MAVPALLRPALLALLCGGPEGAVVRRQQRAQALRWGRGTAGAVHVMDEGHSMEHISLDSIRDADRASEDRGGLMLHCRGQTERPGDVKPAFTQRNNLTFIHIPRCAGTTIEDCSATDPDVAGHWGHANPELAGLHKFPKAHPQDSPFVRSCYRQHVPPSQMPEFFAGKNTFCVVRNPYSRMISEFRFPMTKAFADALDSGGCDARGLNDYVVEKVNLTKSNPWVLDCHMVPQAAYVFAFDQDKFQAISGERKCDHILRYESLQADFNKLMVDFGYEYRLTDKRNPGTHVDNAKCGDLSVSDFSPEALRLVNNLWREDFEHLGYEMVGGL